MELKLAYTLRLTPNEYKTLEWLSDHGYDGGLCEYASSLDMDGDDIDSSTEIVLSFTEPAAWSVREQYDDDEHAYGACAARPLCRKMYEFIDGIV